MRFAALIVIILLALGAGFVALQMTGKKEAAEAQQKQQAAAAQQAAAQPQVQVETVDVLVAKEPIHVGDVIKDTMLDTQPWPKHLVLNGFVVGGTPNANIIGMVARSDFQAREPIIRTKLANPSDSNFLAAALPKGMRAATLAVDAVSGVAGYIFPGDRVDVVLTHNIAQELFRQSQQQEFGGSNVSAIGSRGPTASEILVANTKVLAVNLRSPAVTNAAPDQQQNARDITPSSVTLEVSPEDAQRIRLAEKNGTLSLVLRSFKDIEEVDVPFPSDLTEVSHANGPSAKGQITIVRGTKVDRAMISMPADAPAQAAPPPPSRSRVPVAAAVPAVVPEAAPAVSTPPPPAEPLSLPAAPVSP